MTVSEPNDPILEMLDSLEEAISNDLPKTSVEVEAEAPAPVDDRPRVVTPPTLARYPDPPPRTAGIASRTQGTTAQILSRFKWGA